MARSLVVALATSIALGALACSGAGEESSSAESNLDGTEHAASKLEAGLALIGQRATSVVVTTTPVEHVYAAGQLIKRRGEPTEAFLVDAPIIQELLTTVSMPASEPDCGANLPTSETTLVFRGADERTLGTLFYDSNHCRDWAGLPQDRALYALVNMTVAVDAEKLERLVAGEPAPAEPADQKAPDEP